MMPGQTLRKLVQLPGAVQARLRAGTPRGPRFAGHYASLAAARAAIPESRKAGYDDATIADVSFDWMCQRQAFDYPVILWLSRLLPHGGRVLDLGGHMGTKYIAFADVLDLETYDWTVCDLPALIAAARNRQAKGKLPAAIRFIDDPTRAPACDVLLASGLLQYTGGTLADAIARLDRAPEHVLINKLPLTDGAPFCTHERIGTAQVVYQVRNRNDWTAEVAAAGYVIADDWPIAGLSHRIATHPWLPDTASHGFLLRRTPAEQSESMGSFP